ncbi:MAG TPA: DUF6401 family natural product biosynthesis protein [Pilimelia sp.]|nr:DUF6401 family natural product biosynthesis protein [Pilimelia sp.]
MTSEYTTAAPTGTTERAALVLDDLMARVGVDGLTVAFAHPGLMAAVDQHAAAIREALRAAGRRVDAEAVAGYATSVTAAAHRMGRFMPEPGEADLPGLDWLRAEWHLLRLLAACAIAEDAGWL